MKVVVCAKQVIDIRLPLEIDKDQKGLVEDGLCHTLNPADRCAVEEALRLKEQHGEGEVMVITLGPPQARGVLRECLCMGADRALHLCDTAFDKSDAYATAVVLAQVIRKCDFDLVLCGSRSIDEGSSQVGMIVAEMLDLPQVSAITHLELSHGANKAIVQRKLERGNREVLECPLPAVLSVEADINEPRYPSLPVYLEGLRKEITNMDIGSLGIRPNDVGSSGSLTKVVGMTPPRPRPKKTLMMGDDLSPMERLALLQSGGTQSRSGNILEGEPDYLADQMLRLLREQGFV